MPECNGCFVHLTPWPNHLRIQSRKSDSACRDAPWPLRQKEPLRGGRRRQDAVQRPPCWRSALTPGGRCAPAGPLRPFGGGTPGPAPRPSLASRPPPRPAVEPLPPVPSLSLPHLLPAHASPALSVLRAKKEARGEDVERARYRDDRGSGMSMGFQLERWDRYLFLLRILQKSTQR